MLQALPYKIESNLLDEAESSIPKIDFRLAINQPTGDFFYDPWEIKPEFKDTVWDKILNTLPYKKGEARIIKLDNRECYSSHSDIDDRYHLNITGKESYLIDLTTSTMHKLSRDFTWYEMNAGKLHTAVNFGNRPRYQLVVRKLLFRMDFKNSKTVKITTIIPDLEDARYEFDNQISPLLNKLNKLRAIANFKYDAQSVVFDIEASYLREIKIDKNQFKLVVY